MAQEEQYQIPVFLINGQLDSGKTSFISDTIEMGQFEEAKNKLLIVCEEGEEEYDEKMLKDNGVSMVVLEKEDFTEEKLKELDKQYPKQSNCRFVRLKNTFVFTLVRSRGTGIYAAKQFPPSLSER